MSASAQPRRLLQLYRNILRLHRGMPPTLREMGNKYVRSEFVAHKSATPEQLNTFERAWRDYEQQLLTVQRNDPSNPLADPGRSLTDEEVVSMTPEQIDKLQEAKESLSSAQPDGQPSR